MSKKCLSWSGLSREKIFLGGILFLAFFLRTVSLGEIPPSLARDEASIGYTAYSILKTGKDEHGVFLPLSLKSFGDWKLPLYVYLDIPFVFLSGLKEWVVRFPSALFGTLTVLLVYLLTKKLFTNSLSQYLNILISLLSALFLALNPWHLYFSRVSYEANLALFLTVLGTLLFLKKTGKSLLLSAVCFGLTMFTYHGAHVFTPIFVLGLLLLYWSKIKKERFLPSFLLLCFGFVFLAYFLTLSQAGRTKMGGAGFFNDPVVTYFRSERKRGEHKEINFLVRLIHNRFLIFPYQIGQNYLRVFSSSFLFDKGGENPLHNLEEFGNFYLLDVLLFGAGIVFLLWQRKKETKILAWWIFASPLASSITKDSPHSARSLTIVPPLVIIAAFGFLHFYLFLKQKRFLGRLSFVFLSFCLLFSVCWYFEAYFIHFPLNRARFFNYGYKQAVELAQSLPGAQKVVMIGVENSPYIYFLFYEKYDPDKFRREVEYYPPTADLFYHVKSFGRFEFTNMVDWGLSSRFPKTLFIDVVRGVPKNFPIDGCIRLPSGEPHLAWFSTLPEGDKKEAKEKFGACDLSYLWKEKE